MKKISIILFLFLIETLSSKAADFNTFDLTTVDSWQELPASPAQWKSNTNYKVTSRVVVNTDGNMPSGSQIGVISNGSLTINNANLTVGEDVAIYVAGGTLAINNSSLKTGSNFILNEGELGNISLNNSSVLMGNNSILTINGKYIKGSKSSIKGNSTTLVASIKRIFDENISIDGTWVVERAFPQWFKDEKNPNWAIAINKAIKMKGTGEVFLPRGEYPISTSIYVNFGIKLTGDPGREKSGINSSCTDIVPLSNANNNFNGGYMMLVNVKHEDSKGNVLNVDQQSAQWETHYPNAGTQLQNLTFTCKGNQSYKGVLVAGGVIIDQVTWNGCLQAVASANGTYDDQRIITNCCFYSAGNIKQSRNELYAFDLNGLGDALVFTGNAVHNVDKYTKALRLSMCTGGIVSSNILNGDILFRECKGIAFTSNHCENGATVTIQASTVVNNANFYEKGTKPSIIITNSTDMQNSVVTINGDQFVYYNGVRSDDSGESPSVTAARLMSIDENDIAIDSKSQLTLNDVYRYDVPLRVGIGKQNLFGIQVASIKGNGKTEPNQSFNRFSHQLSKSGVIRTSNKVNKPTTNLSYDRANFYLYGKATATWFGETGDYSYSYEIIDNNGRVAQKSSAMPSYTENKTTIHLEKGQYGVLFCLADEGNANNNTYVKLKRRGSGGTKTVEIPVAGSEHIYDNGISVAGYKWK